MAKDEIHVGNAGTRLIVTIVEDGSAVDISTATVRQIKLEKPSGTVLTKAALFLTDGTDGKIYYDTSAADLDEDGGWEIQGYVEMTGWTGHSEVKGFHVYPNLS